MSTCSVCGSDKVLAKGLCRKHYQSNYRNTQKVTNPVLTDELADFIRACIAEEVAKAFAKISNPNKNTKFKKITSDELSAPLTPDLEQQINGETVILGVAIPSPCIRSARWQVLSGWASKSKIPPDLWSEAKKTNIPWYDPYYHQVKKEKNHKTTNDFASKKSSFSLEELDSYLR
jgi:hypothetical protein